MKPTIISNSANPAILRTVFLQAGDRPCRHATSGLSIGRARNYQSLDNLLILRGYCFNDGGLRWQFRPGFAQEIPCKIYTNVRRADTTATG